MGEIVIREVTTRKELKDFIFLPEKIHRDDPLWLPPIYTDEWKLFDRKKNYSFQHSDAVLYLAFRDKKPTGRIMGIINHSYNSLKKEKNGRFGFLASYNDPDAVHILIEKVEEWARKKGMEKIVGPMGFSDKDPQGFQIEGFDAPYVFITPTNPAYLPVLLENEGYIKEIDLVNYVINIPKELPPFYQKALNRFNESGKYKIVGFRTKREMKPFILPVLELMNETFKEIYGYMPLSDKEKIEFHKRYMTILDPEFVKCVLKDSEVVGFVVGLPDMSEGIRACRGRLFPFGIFNILSSMKKTKKLIFMLGGVKGSYRGKGIDIAMAVSMFNSGISRGMEYIDSHIVLESNKRMRAEYEIFDSRVVKKFRIYQKPLV